MTIKLYWKWIHYDIDQLTWRYGKTNNSDEENKEFSQTGLSESDTNLMFRFATTGTAHLRRILYDFIEEKTEDADDKLNLEYKFWPFTFDDFVDADGHALAEIMHWFIIRWCLWQWCKIFAPSQALMEKMEVDELESQLKKMMSDSGMPMKERRKPIEDLSEIEFTYTPNGATE